MFFVKYFSRFDKHCIPLVRVLSRFSKKWLVSSLDLVLSFSNHSCTSGMGETSWRYAGDRKGHFEERNCWTPCILPYSSTTGSSTKTCSVGIRNSESWEALETAGQLSENDRFCFEGFKSMPRRVYTTFVLEAKKHYTQFTCTQRSLLAYRRTMGLQTHRPAVLLYISMALSASKVSAYIGCILGRSLTLKDRWEHWRQSATSAPRAS